MSVECGVSDACATVEVRLGWEREPNRMMMTTNDDVYIQYNSKKSIFVHSSYNTFLVLALCN